MRFAVYVSQCTCRGSCSETCDWRILEDAMVSRQRALVVAADATLGPMPDRPGPHARAKVFARGKTVIPVLGTEGVREVWMKRLIGEFRRDKVA